jgi:hypothetical protein
LVNRDLDDPLATLELVAYAQADTAIEAFVRRKMHRGRPAGLASTGKISQQQSFRDWLPTGVNQSFTSMAEKWFFNSLSHEQSLDSLVNSQSPSGDI